VPANLAQSASPQLRLRSRISPPASSVDKRRSGVRLLVVAFIPVHYEPWDRFAVWYHLVLLASLVAAIIFGAMCYSYYARRKGEPLAD